MRSLESGFQHGTWDLYQENGEKHLRLWKDVVLIFAVCRSKVERTRGLNDWKWF